MVETSRAQVAVEPGRLVLPHVYAEVAPRLVHLAAQVAPVLPRLTVRRHVLPQRPLTAELLQAHPALVRFLACGDFFVNSFRGFLFLKAEHRCMGCRLSKYVWLFLFDNSKISYFNFYFCLANREV